MNLCQNCTALALSELQDMLEGRLSKERVLAKSKVKKAVKRTVAKKAVLPSKTRPAKAVQQVKTLSKAKTVSKTKKVTKPVVVVEEQAVIAPAVEVASAPKIPAPPPASPPCEVLTVKRPTVSSERTVKAGQRADLPPTAGFTLLVDGHFKSQFDALDLVKEAGSKLLSKFPKLRVEIYDATKKTRTPI